MISVIIAYASATMDPLATFSPTDLMNSAKGLFALCMALGIQSEKVEINLFFAQNRKN